MRESRLREIKRRCLLIFPVIQLNGEGQREEEPWNLGAGVSEAQVQAIVSLTRPMQQSLNEVSTLSGSS